MNAKPKENITKLFRAEQRLNNEFLRKVQRR